MSLMLFRAAAVFLALGGLAHTFGGMLGMARLGPRAGAEADRVLAEMRGVRFRWRGADCSWYDFWLGNGLGVSALLPAPIVLLWTLGDADAALRAALAPLGWVVVASLAALTALGFRFFAAPVGVAFGLVAALAGAALLVG